MINLTMKTWYLSLSERPQDKPTHVGTVTENKTYQWQPLGQLGVVPPRAQRRLTRRNSTVVRFYGQRFGGRGAP